MLFLFWPKALGASLGPRGASWDPCWPALIVPEEEFLPLLQVGNALNSVNVSRSLTDERLLTSLLASTPRRWFSLRESQSREGRT